MLPLPTMRLAEARRLAATALEWADDVTRENFNPVLYRPTTMWRTAAERDERHERLSLSR